VSKKGNRSRGKIASNVNPQGFGQDSEYAADPKTALENRAKKANTKG